MGNSRPWPEAVDALGAAEEGQEAAEVGVSLLDRIRARAAKLRDWILEPAPSFGFSAGAAVSNLVVGAVLRNFRVAEGSPGYLEQTNRTLEIGTRLGDLEIRVSARVKAVSDQPMLVVSMRAGRGSRPVQGVRLQVTAAREMHSAITNKRGLVSALGGIPVEPGEPLKLKISFGKDARSIEI